jgi:hypothetical protein
MLATSFFDFVRLHGFRTEVRGRGLNASAGSKVWWYTEHVHVHEAHTRTPLRRIRTLRGYPRPRDNATTHESTSTPCNSERMETQPIYRLVRPFLNRAASGGVPVTILHPHS